MAVAQTGSDGEREGGRRKRSEGREEAGRRKGLKEGEGKGKWKHLSFYILAEKTKAVEQKFTQLKDIYQKLRNEHIQLLRTNGETQKKLNQTETKLLQEEEEKTVDT